MNGEIDNGRTDVEDDDDVDELEDSEDTVVMSEDVADIDDIGDISAEFSLEQLVAKLESGEIDAEAHQKEVRRRLEEIEEQRRAEKELDSTYNFNIDEELQ